MGLLQVIPEFLSWSNPKFRKFYQDGLYPVVPHGDYGFAIVGISPIRPLSANPDLDRSLRLRSFQLENPPFMFDWIIRPTPTDHLVRRGYVRACPTAI